MIETLILLIIVCLVAYLLIWLLRKMSLPDPIYTVAVVVLALVILAWAAQRFGLF